MYTILECIYPCFRTFVINLNCCGCKLDHFLHQKLYHNADMSSDWLIGINVTDTVC